MASQRRPTDLVCLRCATAVGGSVKRCTRCSSHYHASCVPDGAIYRPRFVCAECVQHDDEEEDDEEEEVDGEDEEEEEEDEDSDYMASDCDTGHYDRVGDASRRALRRRVRLHSDTSSGSQDTPPHVIEEDMDDSMDDEAPQENVTRVTTPTTGKNWRMFTTEEDALLLRCIFTHKSHGWEKVTAAYNAEAARSGFCERTQPSIQNRYRYARRDALHALAQKTPGCSAEEIALLRCGNLHPLYTTEEDALLLRCFATHKSHGWKKVTAAYNAEAARSGFCERTQPSIQNRHKYARGKTLQEPRHSHATATRGAPTRAVHARQRGGDPARQPVEALRRSTAIAQTQPTTTTMKTTQDHNQAQAQVREVQAPPTRSKALGFFAKFKTLFFN